MNFTEFYTKNWIIGKFPDQVLRWPRAYDISTTGDGKCLIGKKDILKCVREYYDKEGVRVGKRPNITLVCQNVQKCFEFEENDEYREILDCCKCHIICHNLYRDGKLRRKKLKQTNKE